MSIKGERESIYNRGRKINLKRKKYSKIFEINPLTLRALAQRISVRP